MLISKTIQCVEQCYMRSDFFNAGHCLIIELGSILPVLSNRVLPTFRGPENEDLVHHP